MLNPLPANADTGLGTKSKQLEAELQEILKSRGATLQKLESAPKARMESFASRCHWVEHFQVLHLCTCVLVHLLSWSRQHGVINAALQLG